MTDSTQSDSSRRRFLQGAALSAALGAGGGAGSTALAASTAMPTRPLGRTGVALPILHLGTAQRLDPVYDKVMHRCFRAGVTVFDTALSYGWGSSHRAIATFIEQMGDRRQLFLTSKSGSGTPTRFAADIDRALEQLQTDYLDLYLMHGINRLSALAPEFLRAGEQLKARGKTRLFGFSCHGGNVVELMNRAAEVGGVDVILFRYNFRRYGDRALNLAIDRCHRAGIGLLAMKTMGSVPSDLEAVARFRSEQFTLGQAKLKSVWADERIAAIVSEMDSVGVARENIAAATSPASLAAEEVHQLNQLAALTDHYACHGCSHLCQNAIRGETAVADQLRYLSYYECYGKGERARELYHALPVAARAFDEDDLAQGTMVCPQGIDIAARLKRARQVLA